MSRTDFLAGLSDQTSIHSYTKIYLAIFLLALLILVPLTIFTLTRPTRLKPAAAPNATLALSPTNQTVQVGDRFNVFVTLNTKENFTDGVDVIINYDSSKLRIYGPIETKSMPYATVVGKQHNACGNLQPNLRGRIIFSGLAYDANRLPTPPPHNPVSTNNRTITIATLPFEAIASGNAQVEIFFQGQSITTDSNVVETKTNQDLLSNVVNATYTIREGNPISPTPTPCPSLTPTPSNTPPTPTPTPPPVPYCTPQYDLDCDGLICDSDANILLSNWRKQSAPYICPVTNLSCDPDFDHDGDVYGKEVSVLMSNWSGIDCDRRGTTPTP